MPNVPVDRVIIISEVAKLNEHDNANRNNRFGGANLKKDMTNKVMADVMAEEPIGYPIEIGLTWYYSSKHDFDNIRFGVKYILDGMIKAGILPNDNQNWVKGFLYDKFIKVEKGEEGVDLLIRAYNE